MAVFAVRPTTSQERRNILFERRSQEGEVCNQFSHEQTRSQSPSVRYEWLCGRPPFHGSVLEVHVGHVSTPPPPLRNHVPSISPAVEHVVLKALSKDPQQRFAHVMDFASALKQATARKQMCWYPPHWSELHPAQKMSHGIPSATGRGAFSQAEPTSLSAGANTTHEYNTARWKSDASVVHFTFSIITMLITLSSRFLLILFPERTRRVTWVVARNPAGWAFEFGNALQIHLPDRQKDGLAARNCITARRESQLTSIRCQHGACSTAPGKRISVGRACMCSV
jgi:hypothetical protein